MQDHGTPSATEQDDIGGYIQFQTAVLPQLPRPYQISKEIRESWLSNQRRLQEVLWQVLVPQARPEFDLDMLVEDIFTEELCCKQLGHDVAVHTRFLTACHRSGLIVSVGNTKMFGPIRTLREVVSMTEREWLHVPQVGRKVINMIKDALLVYSLRLGMQVGEPPMEKWEVL